MRKIGMLLAIVAGVLATTQLAAARDGCGRGWVWDGYRCVPARPAPGPGYGPGYYAPPPPPAYYAPPPPPAYYGPRGWRPAYMDRHGQQTYYPGPRGTCPRNYTVQDGVCKPYRGY